MAPLGGQGSKKGSKKSEANGKERYGEKDKARNLESNAGGRASCLSPSAFRARLPPRPSRQVEDLDRIVQAALYRASHGSARSAATPRPESAAYPTPTPATPAARSFTSLTGMDMAGSGSAMVACRTPRAPLEDGEAEAGSHARRSPQSSAPLRPLDSNTNVE